jgi:Na+/H+ antiporter NhaD/arsenite permease-like protein
LGAIVLYSTGIVSNAMGLNAIDFPTLIVLFGLMVLSAQFAACGFYDWCSARIAATHTSPMAILALTVSVAGTLSALLANDVVVFAMTPMLIQGLSRRGLDPRPYLIALAGAANAGSAATVIGNPQNILIGQVGRLDFWGFAAACGPPALLGLATVFAVTWIVWRRTLSDLAVRDSGVAIPRMDRFGVAKGIVAAAVLLALFSTRSPHVADVLLVTAVLLVSRRLATREVLGLVDWHLLVLFGGLFIVTAALAETALPGQRSRRNDGLWDRPAWAPLDGAAEAIRKQHDRQCPDRRSAYDRSQRPADRNPLCHGGTVDTRWESAHRR